MKKDKLVQILHKHIFLLMFGITSALGVFAYYNNSYIHLSYNAPDRVLGFQFQVEGASILYVESPFEITICNPITGMVLGYNQGLDNSLDSSGPLCTIYLGNKIKTRIVIKDIQLAVISEYGVLGYYPHDIYIYPKHMQNQDR